MEGMGGTSDAFCLGNGTVMNSGFQPGFGDSQACVLFLFPGWVLDDAGKYAAGCVAAFLIPVVIVMVQTFRDYLVEMASTKGKMTGLIYDGAAAVLFGAQMCLAYAVMLLTMTYESMLFTSIILGFMFAFFVLRRLKRHKWSTTLDKASVVGAPCCSSTEDTKV